MKDKIFSRLYAVICRLFNFIILGRERVEIETPQFLGSQDKFYMLKQVGWIHYVTLKFKHDKKIGATHDVQFHSIEDAYKSVIRWF
jgi:hypothetical protein